MPLGDQKHQTMYRELVNTLGEQYVHHDPAVVECYRREQQSPPATTPMNAEFIVLPGSTEEVQAIVKLANRYVFPYSVSTTGTFGAGSAALKDYWVWIDLKRMTGLSIDPRNMIARVQPYVSHAQLSAEARKLGLFNAAPSAGAQTSALVNTIMFGMQTPAYRTGRASRNLLGAEMVLPNGDVLRTGSLAMPGDQNFWGEGPGPDLRGIVRGGHMGHQGSMGIVTGIALKLFPWPGPAVLPTSGEAPCKTVKMPEDTFRWHLIHYSKVHDGARAMREIARAEIGAVVAMFGPWNMAHHISKSREEHHRLEESGWFREHFRFVLLIGIWGTTSKRQVEYEEKVLHEIMAETGGAFVDQEVFDAWAPFVVWRNLIDPLAARTQRIPSVPPPRSIGGGVYDALSDCDWLIPEDPPDITLWIVPIDLAHCAMISFMSAPTVGERTRDDEKRMMAEMMEKSRKRVERQMSDTAVLNSPMHMVAPQFNSKMYLPVHRLKKSLDPLNLANPTRALHLESLEILAKKDGAG